MQAPATPLSVRHGPFGQDLQYGPVVVPGYGVIHELGVRSEESALVLHGPSTRPGPGTRAGSSRSGLQGPLGGFEQDRQATPVEDEGGRRSGGGGHNETPEGTSGPAVESADVATCDLKTSVPWPLRARPTVRRSDRWPLPGYPRASLTTGRFSGGYPPLAHRTALEVDRGWSGPGQAGPDQGPIGGAPGRSPHPLPRRAPPPAPSAGTTKRPKEPLGPSVRLRRCKHLRLGLRRAPVRSFRR